MRTHSVRAAQAAALLLFCLATGRMTAQAVPAETASAATLQTQTNEVLLDLVVRDKHNRPVSDLLASQIEITDNQAPVKLSRLRMITGGLQSAPLITLLFDRPAEAPANASPEDRLFASPESSKKLNEAAQKLLKSFPVSGFSFAVMDVWGRLQIQQDFTSDRKAITAALPAALVPGKFGVAVTPTAVEQRLARIAQTGQDATGRAAGADERALARAMVRALNTSSHVRKDQHLTSALACILALVESEQSIAGRKAIVYFTTTKNSAGNSGAKALSDNESKRAIQSVIGAANRAGVSIYIVRLGDLAASKEINQMLNSFATMSAGQTMSDPSKYYSYSSTGSSGGGGLAMAKDQQYMSPAAFRMLASRQEGDTNLDGLDDLAKQTGGVTLDAELNLSTPVKELARDLTTYYEASYTPPAGEEDGSFHSIDVKPLRSGIKVRSRTGYLALPRSAGITEPPQAYELPLMAVLNRPELPGEFGYHATVVRLGRQQDGTMNLLAVETPLSQLEVHKDGNTHLSTAHLTVLANVKDSTGTVIERFSEDVSRRWTEAEENESDSISFVRPFSAPPGRYVLETALLDGNSKKSAARRQSFEIAAGTLFPEISEPILVRKTEPMEADEAGMNPLQFGDRLVEPNMSGQLPEGGKNISVYLLVHTDPEVAEAGELKLEVLRAGAPLNGAALITKLQGSTEFHPVLNSFSLSAAPGGQYQLRATLNQAGKTTGSTSQFTLAGEAESATAGDGGTLLSELPSLALAEQSASRPAPAALDQLLAEARQAALEYKNSLPNLICQQSTARFNDARGEGAWHQRDTLVEILTYVDQVEDRTQIGQIENGAVHTADKAKVTGVASAGEFGEALSGIFQAKAKTVFTWKQSATLRGAAVEVFDYKIEQAHSTFSLRANSNMIAMAGYHGKIYVDRSTHGVRSLTMIADDIPKNFPLRRVAVRIDYDYVAMNNHDYLLPVGAQVVAGSGGRSLERNDLSFSNFRRYGSTARIVETPETPANGK